MDICTVSDGCAGALANLAHLSNQISVFVSSVRDARRDMDAVSRELTSLSLCLEALRDDSTKIAYSHAVAQNLLQALRNCDSAMEDMAFLLEQLSLGEVQWKATGMQEMSRLRLSIEQQKVTLNIALDMNSMQVAENLLSNAVDETSTESAISTKMEGPVTMLSPAWKRDNLRMQELVREIDSLHRQLFHSAAKNATALQLQSPSRSVDDSSVSSIPAPLYGLENPEIANTSLFRRYANVADSRPSNTVQKQVDSDAENIFEAVENGEGATDALNVTASSGKPVQYTASSDVHPKNPRTTQGPNEMKGNWEGKLLHIDRHAINHNNTESLATVIDLSQRRPSDNVAEPDSSHKVAQELAVSDEVQSCVPDNLQAEASSPALRRSETGESVPNFSQVLRKTKQMKRYEPTDVDKEAVTKAANLRKSLTRGAREELDEALQVAVRGKQRDQRSESAVHIG